jgi:hypothetical protein
MEDYAATYRRFTDDEIAALEPEIATLTGNAQAALETEIRARGLSKQNLEMLRGQAKQSAKRFDKRERIERKQDMQLVFGPRLGWKDWLLVIGVCLVLVAVRSCNHSR